MKKIISAIISSPLNGRLCGLLFAFLATTTLWAYDFQFGDLYYNITSDTTVEVTYIEYYSSSNYANLATATIPESVIYNGTTYSVTSIGSEAFFGCSSLTSITIPNSVTSIGELVFAHCTSLTSITIPNSVMSIGYGIFLKCVSLTIPIYNANCFAFLPSTFEGAYTILEGIKHIAGNAFSSCSELTSVTIPNSVTSIGEYAFRDCSSLTSVAIPNSVTSIGEYAFYGCSSLTSVTIPNSVTSIGDFAFSGCRSITSPIYNAHCFAYMPTSFEGTYTIPKGIKHIAGSAFSRCTSLTSLIIPSSVTSIGEMAFYGCSSLTSIVIPDSVTSIGSSAFSDCSSLNTITIPNSVTSIGDYAFSRCSSLISITIPNSVTSIGHGIFFKCVSLTIPIYNANCFAFLPSTFEGAYTILEGIKHIAGSAFSRCASLTSLTIPSSVTSIGYSAFANCSSLTTIICKTTEVPKLEDEVFFNIPLSGATLYVPVQSLDDYKAAEQWKDFGTILPIEEEEHEEKIELQDTEMTIVFTNSEDNDSEIYCQPITIKVPTAPAIEGFTFLYWQPVAEPITNEITIQAIYEADTPTATEVYINPANPTQKLLRNGQLYILKDGKTYNIMGAEFK